VTVESAYLRLCHLAAQDPTTVAVITTIAVILMALTFARRTV
jgi:hypothetical protein